MKRFIITEEDKKHIMGLYEQSNSNKVGSIEYFNRNPKGTFTLKPNSNLPIIININNLPVDSDLFSNDDTSYFTRLSKTLWFNDSLEMTPEYNFDSGNGKFKYEFKSLSNGVAYISMYRDPSNGCKNSKLPCSCTKHAESLGCKFSYKNLLSK